MARCGCRGDACSCIVVAGRNTRVTGSGQLNNPYIVDSFPMSLSVSDTATVNLTLTGTGTGTDPWAISADLATGALSETWKRWTGTQAEYDALPTPRDPGTLYLVT